MGRILQLNLLLLFMLGLSCQKEQELSDENKAPVDHLKFSEAYSQTKNTSLDDQTRLKAANMAYNIANQEQSDSLLSLALDRKTLLHNKVLESDSAILYSKQLLRLVKKNNDSAGIAKAYYKLGLYNDATLVKDSAFYYYNESKKVLEALKDSAGVGLRLRNMAILVSRSGNYIQSNELAIEGLGFLKNIDDQVSKGSFLNCIAINGKQQKQYDESLYWYKQALETTLNSKHKNIYLSNIANIYRDKGDYEEAIKLYQQILAIPEIANDPKEYARILDNLSYAQWLLNQDNSSLSSLKKALSLREDANNRSGQITSHDHLTQYYLENDMGKAALHAHKMYELAVKIKNTHDQLEALRLLMKTSVNKPIEYRNYANEYMTIGDSLDLNKNKLGAKFAMIRYDASKKRTENEMLKTKSIEEQLALEESKRMNSIYLSLGVISIFVFVFILLVLRERHQKEKLEEVVLTESRISKRVHDEVANDLYQVMTKLEKQPTEKDALLNDLDHIYSKTRDISRENNALDLDQDFGELLSDLLMSYKSNEINIITKGLKKVSWNKTSALKKTAIFRVIQELMTNMKKHSQAQIVILSFDEMKHKVLIKYSDDGIGCAMKKNNGLLNAENRITSLKGKFTLQSEKNKGFKATIII